MKIELTHDTIVRLPKGTVITVPNEEGKRLIALGNAKQKETVKKK